MIDVKKFEVVIVGGSYAGLSAAMALGRSLRSVLIIDGGQPCNRQTPHSHNFITHDGAKPKEIAERAKSQVLAYPTVQFLEGNVMSASKTQDGFIVRTDGEETFMSRKILFTTGVKDLMPDIKGFAACWGISVLHCPYCHGYEVAHQNLGIIANGDTAFELCTLIQHWTEQLTLFTNGKAHLSEEQMQMVERLRINVIEKEISALVHTDGYLEHIAFADGSASTIDAIYARVPFEQHCDIPATLGCNTTDHGHFEVDMFQKTNVPGVFCAGDNTSPMRSVSLAISSGNKAGAFINMELIQEALPK